MGEDERRPAVFELEGDVRRRARGVGRRHDPTGGQHPVHGREVVGVVRRHHQRDAARFEVEDVRVQVSRVRLPTDELGMGPQAARHSRNVATQANIGAHVVILAVGAAHDDGRLVAARGEAFREEGGEVRARSRKWQCDGRPRPVDHVVASKLLSHEEETPPPPPSEDGTNVVHGGGSIIYINFEAGAAAAAKIKMQDLSSNKIKISIC